MNFMILIINLNSYKTKLSDYFEFEIVIRIANNTPFPDFKLLA